MIRVAVLSLMLAAPLAAQDQGWGDLDSLLFSTLTESGRAEATYWLPNHPDPAVATFAFGFAYEHIPGSAGSVGIVTGLYDKMNTGWSLIGTISGIYGYEPKDVLFAAEFAEITTSTLGPNDPRCCPTQETRWRIDLATLSAIPINK